MAADKKVVIYIHDFISVLLSKFIWEEREGGIN